MIMMLVLGFTEAKSWSTLSSPAGQPNFDISYNATSKLFVFSSVLSKNSSLEIYFNTKSLIQTNASDSVKFTGSSGAVADQWGTFNATSADTTNSFTGTVFNLTFAKDITKITTFRLADTKDAKSQDLNITCGSPL
jgi:hypothetical protein